MERHEYDKKPIIKASLHEISVIGFRNIVVIYRESKSLNVCIFDMISNKLKTLFSAQ